MVELLSVVIPCRNEQKTINTLYRQIIEYTSSCVKSVEIIFVDDGSSDQTLLSMKYLSTIDPRVRAISLSRNFGKEGAMLAGLRKARGDAVVIMDGDLQHPARLLPDMVAAFNNGAQQVIAQRTRDHDPWTRRVTSWFYYRLVNAIIDVPIQNGSGDFRLVSRAVVDAVVGMPEVNRYSKGLFSWVGFGTTTIPYQNVAREAGKSRWTFRALFQYAIDSVLSFNNKPLRMGIWVGILSVLLSLAYVVWMAVRYVAFGVEAPGYLTTITAIVFLGGIQITFLGILGEYIGRIYYETKLRPSYLIAYDSGAPVREAPRTGPDAEPRTEFFLSAPKDSDQQPQRAPGESVDIDLTVWEGIRATHDN